MLENIPDKNIRAKNTVISKDEMAFMDYGAVRSDGVMINVQKYSNGYEKSSENPFNLLDMIVRLCYIFRQVVIL